MDTLILMESINEAIRILRKAARESANGSLSIWRMIDHAESHLDAQIAELLAA